MMDVIEIFLSSMLVGLIFHVAIKYFTRRSGLPPGPIALPFIGNLHLLGEHVHETLTDMSKKYGSVFTFDFGQLRMVVISDFATAKEVLIQRGVEFAGRPTFLTAELLSHGRKDIIFSDYGKGWKFHRKVAHSALRMFGEGMDILEEVIQCEVECLCQRFEETENSAFDPATDIHLVVMNIICKMLFGGTFQREDPEFIKFKDNMHYIVNDGNLFDMFDVIPILQWLPWKEVNKLKGTINEMDEFLLKKLKMEWSNNKCQILDENTKAENYIQALLKAKQEAEKEDSEVKEYLTEDHLLSTLFDLFVAGSETTAAALKWCLLYMANWPEIQEKVHIELDQQVGKPDEANFVHLVRKPVLPYLEAVVMETQRLATIVPLGVFHKAMKGTTLGGYDIPKGTGIAINQWALHHDESYWMNPFHFDPNRFLDMNGKIVRDPSIQYIPFSAGPRVCLGESLARSELFLCLSNLFHRFHFTFPSTEERPSLQGKSKGILCPRPYRIIAKKRF